MLNCFGANCLPAVQLSNRYLLSTYYVPDTGNWTINKIDKLPPPFLLELYIAVEASRNKNKQINMQYKRSGSSQYCEEKLSRPSGWWVARLLILMAG